MNCPNCGTYNPDDRTICWRCDKELPMPKPVKKKDPQKSSQTMLYVLIAAFAVFTVLQMCGSGLSSGPETPASEGPTGRLTRPVPIAYVVTIRRG